MAAHTDHSAKRREHADVTCTAANTWYGVTMPRHPNISLQFRGGDGYLSCATTDIDAGTSLTNCFQCRQDVIYEFKGLPSTIYLAHAVAGGKVAVLYGV